MYAHHDKSIEKLKAKLAAREDILALLVSGSIAHGFAKPSSDVDVMIVVSEEDYARRMSTGETTYWENESTDYESGYVDGKYISCGFMKQVAEKGSEPARFAFEGAIIAMSSITGVEELLADIVRYPAERKQENIARFLAQLEAWKWYSAEALKHDNLYLLRHAVNNLVLFGGRLILAHNEMLYPYHKWFLNVLEKAPDRPEGFLQFIERMLQEPTAEHIEEYYQTVRTFTDWGDDGRSWPSRFMEDSELNWLGGYTPVGDI